MKCQKCGKEWTEDSKMWRCECGGILDIKIDSEFPVNEIEKRDNSIWRYREALPPVKDENIISFKEGFTPLIPLNIREKEVMVKIDYLFPSGSFKDRGASVMVSKLREIGIKKVVEDSSGNAGAAVAAYCAKAGIKCDIYVPAENPEEKIFQIKSYGARVIKVEGTRKQTAEEALKASEDTYYASHHWNPYFIQGTKTFAFEVVEQMGWVAPDKVILPVGSGSLFIGTYTGFRELLKADIIDKIPEMTGVQAENCAPISMAFKKGRKVVSKIKVEPTVAEGISIEEPIRGKQILKIAEETGGSFLTVTEDEIIEALLQLLKMGLFVEPTSAATISGVNRYCKNLKKEQTIVTVLTGTGLKEAGKIGRILEGEKRSPVY